MSKSNMGASGYAVRFIDSTCLRSQHGVSDDTDLEIQLSCAVVCRFYNIRHHMDVSLGIPLAWTQVYFPQASAEGLCAELCCKQ